MNEQPKESRRTGTRVEFKPEQRAKLFQIYGRLRAANDKSGKKRFDSALWREALQELVPEGPWPSSASFLNYRKDFEERVKRGEIENIEIAPHDHRPARAREIVAKQTAPEVSAPVPTTPAPVLAPAPSPTLEMPASASPHALPGAFGVVDTALMTLVRHVVQTEVMPIFVKMLDDLQKTVALKLDDQYLRMLDYWDPDLAKQIREKNAELPPLDHPHDNVGQAFVTGLSVTPPAPPPPKYRVLVCGGKEDGFHTFLPDALQKHNVFVEFCDGHKPRSIPTGKRFDAVIAHWMTSHAAMAVLKNYYPDAVLMNKGSTSRLISTILEKLGLQT